MHTQNKKIKNIFFFFEKYQLIIIQLLSLQKQLFKQRAPKSTKRKKNCFKIILTSNSKIIFLSNKKTSQKKKSSTNITPKRNMTFLKKNRK